MSPTWILETERLRLRSWSLGDAEEAFRRVFSDAEVTRFIGNRTPDKTVEESRGRIQRLMDQEKKRGCTLWAMIEKTSGDLIGGCGLKPLEDGELIEVGYYLARSAWNCGYASEAARASLRYGFERMKLDEIVAVVDPLNSASQRVLLKIGMRYEGMGRYYGKELQKYVINREQLGS